LIVIIIASCSLCFGIEGLLIDEGYDYRVVKHENFRIGEKLDYRVSWVVSGIKLLEVGYGELDLKETLLMKNREVYHVIFKVKTAPFFDVLFKIRDVMDCYIDRAGVFSWGFSMDIREGKTHYTRETRFDQRNHSGIHKSSLRNLEKKTKILPFMQDFISAVYYIRVFDMQKEKNITFNIDNDGYAYEAAVTFIGQEKIKTSIGKIMADKLILSWYKVGRKKQKEKESHLLWISADKNRIPLKVESFGDIGKFVTSLKEIDNEK